MTGALFFLAIAGPCRWRQASRCRLTWLLLLACIGRSLAAERHAELPLLTHASEIRQLSRTEAERQYPVRLRGVITYYDREYVGAIVQDDTAGLYVFLPGALDLVAGYTVELEGTSTGGGFAPSLRASRVTVTGTGPLPAPKPVSFDELTNGREDTQWVEIRGVVRHVGPTANRGLNLTVAMAGGGRLACLLLDGDMAFGAQIEGTRVRIRGACLSRSNNSRQMRTAWLGIASREQIIVEQAPGAEPPLTAISHLLRFHADGHDGERARVRGAVTAVQPGKALFVQDGVRGLFVQTAQATPVAVGEVVEIVGFPVPGPYRPSLEDATYQLTGDTRPLVVADFDVAEAQTNWRDTDLVRVQAVLLNRVRRGSEQLMVLRSGDVTFDAFLPDAAPVDPLAWLQNGSRLALTGVCLVDQEENWKPRVITVNKPFRLLLRAPGDVVLLAPPKWWTLQKLLWIVVALLLVICAGVAWVVVLRRRVQRQTEIIQRKVQLEAVAEERNRLAREFHDTLEQELAAITMQLDAADAQFERSLTQSRQLLNLARSMSRRSFSEIKRTVWDLRSRFLENNDLPTALAQAIKPASVQAAVFPRVEVHGAVRRLPARVENHLLRIGQEAVNNAVKHARARNIVVALDYRTAVARLQVRDDGRGFDAACASTAAGGHFGLVDMRERAEKIGSALILRSTPGEGTEITVEIKTTVA